MSEYVYILTNPAIPAWVKIGQTNDIRQRIKDLSRDVGVPFAFQEYAHLEVADSQKMESILHDMIKNDYKKRRSINEITMREKEFFELSAEEAYAIFQKVEALVASQGGKAKLVKAEPTDAELADQE
ncbi:MAG: GIY-YIG nuclease family protein, partial [Planctomycetaceae bacterium]|nr:GIY-YIG nuclease family protein [Planctomycetaceae bacterium]